MHEPDTMTRSTRAAIGAVLVAAILVTPLATAAPSSGEAVLDLAARRDIIDRRIADYREMYPEVEFLWLEGGDGWRGNMVALHVLLGSGSTNLDYVAPALANADLLEVNLDRIARFLHGNVVSAATFRVGDGALAKRPYVCLVALNPRVFATDPVAATRQMVDISEEEFAQVHPGRLLDTGDHLSFAVDHEIFHCLESIYYGGMPLTGEKYGGEYHGFQRDSAADSFALAMHLRDHGSVTDYTENILLIRALWMVTECPDICALEPIRAIQSTPADILSDFEPMELVDYVIDLRDRMVSDYELFEEARPAMRGAAAALGLGPPDTDPASQSLATARAVQRRIDRYHFYFRQLFVDKPVVFAPSGRE